jgi:hypothetical protein
VLGRPKMRRRAAELEREYAVTEGQSLPASALQRGGWSDARSRRSSLCTLAVNSRKRTVVRGLDAPPRGCRGHAADVRPRSARHSRSGAAGTDTTYDTS